MKLNHDIEHITATCYDSEEVLLQKYGAQIRTNLEKLLNPKLSVDHFSNQVSNLEEEETLEDEWTGFSSETCDHMTMSEVPSNLSTGADSAPKDTKISVYYATDATKLSKHSRSIGFGARPRTRTAPYTKIVFNFPHVGGLSTDVNRQVRANQELLVGFFKAAIPLLASSRRPCFHKNSVKVDEDFFDDPPEPAVEEITTGQILVTLFEGEPYSLWNIRDLARHSSLKVVESFRFPWESYPGYRHARTMGEVKTGKDRSAEGKRKGAWRGEEREARCYVLEVKDEVVVQDLSAGTGGNSQVLGKRKGRGRGGEEGVESESDD